MSKTGIYLFSIDLEDIRLRLANPGDYRGRVPACTHLYLGWLRKHRARCTFFVTGNMAVLYPALIREIAAEGHEIACHTQEHLALDKQSPEELKADLRKNIVALKEAGAETIEGFRAPYFSLVGSTQWAYEVLAGEGFTYSSSVLPARNPQYGWEDFGCSPRRMNGNILEIPVTVGKFGPLTVPVAGGLYFRVFPFPFIRKQMKSCITRGIPAAGYFHPYDIDTDQERYMNPGINNSPVLNFLMYYNRGRVFDRLDRIMDLGFRIMTYSEFARDQHNR